MALILESIKKIYTEGSVIDVRIIRKQIKNIYLRVYPPDGKVVVSAPLRMPDKAISDFIRSRQRWIVKNHNKLKQRDQVKKHNYEDGDLHLYEGKEYKLETRFVDKGPSVLLEGDSIIMLLRDNLSIEQKENLMNSWYREKLYEKLPLLVEKWEKRMNLKVNEVRIRKMKTRWGSCNTLKRRIWLNLELAKHSDRVLEYIIVHEMAHLIERKHNSRFHGIVNKHLPDWKERKKSLR